jgi:general secretion pathway protein D
LLDTQGFELTFDSTAKLYRARPRDPPKSAIVSAPPAATAPAGRQQQVEFFVIALKHARAADVAQTINSLYGRMTAFGETGRTQTLADQLRANQVPPTAPAQPQRDGNTDAAARSATFTGEVTIVPDSRSNSLLLRANRGDFELIQSAVEQLDVRPLQVLIEVVIAEVRRNRSLSISADATLHPTTVGHNGSSISVNGPGPGLGDFAIQVMKLGSLNLDAALAVAAGKGEVRILDREILLTLNNDQAEINVGSQRPFVQVSRTLPTDAATRDQIVEYKDVGTKLSVRPTISNDGSVQLEVSQEVSSATNEVQFNAPVISTRSVQTSPMVTDGQMVVLGGLIDRQKEVTSSGIPILSSIPILGGFFGSSSRTTTETELYVFLTPRVVRNDEDADAITAPFREKAIRVKP